MVAEDARVVTDELMRLRRLATRMLLLASAGGPDFLQLAPVVVESVVIDAFDRWSHTPRRWGLTTVPEATVNGDRERLALALDALLENAIAHTGEHDRIDVSVRCADGQVILAVADSGSGIPAGDLERIFHRFARADPRQSREAGGFGLGLAIVQAIAEAHHGSVRVESTLGEGSVFELLLPLAATSPVSPPPVSPAGAELAAGGADELAGRLRRGAPRGIGGALPGEWPAAGMPGNPSGDDPLSCCADDFR